MNETSRSNSTLRRGPPGTPQEPITVIVLGAALMLGSHAAPSADAKPEAKKPTWETVANAGVTLTRGNSKNFLASAGINSSKKWSKDEVFLGANAAYGNTTVKGEQTTTDHYLKGSGQYNHIFDDRPYGGIKVDGVYDKIAGIHYRFTISPLAGYYFIKATNMLLSAEVGPSLITEEVVSKINGRDRIDENTYLALRVGQRFEYKFGSGAKLWETLEWMPQVTDFNNWLLNFELGLSAPITKKLEARLVLDDTYDNVPPVGRLKNDLKLIAGLAYKF